MGKNRVFYLFGGQDFGSHLSRVRPWFRSVVRISAAICRGCGHGFVPEGALRGYFI
jgi:hypothetical protein